MPVYNDQLIDDYLLNNLNNNDRMEFEKTLNQNEELRREVELRRHLIKGAKNVGRDQMKERLKKIHAEVNKSPTIRRRIWPLLSAIAASVALIVFSWFFFNKNNNKSTQELFAANYQPYPLSLTSRDDADAELATLNQLYNNGEYKAALPLFEKALQQTPNNARMLLGAGICLLESEQAEKARIYFSRILESQDIRLSDIANWYTALAYLKEGKTDLAKASLSTLVNNPKADRHLEAKVLIESIH